MKFLLTFPLKPWWNMFFKEYSIINEYYLQLFLWKNENFEFWRKIVRFPGSASPSRLKSATAHRRVRPAIIWPTLLCLLRTIRPVDFFFKIRIFRICTILGRNISYLFHSGPKMQIFKKKSFWENLKKYDLKNYFLQLTNTSFAICASWGSSKTPPERLSKIF